MDEEERHRRIIHIDMDAFFASVEQRDNPALKGLPVAVGGLSERGVVAAASYEARKFGVHSAMPSVTARRKCPDLVFVKARFDVYKEVSTQIREIFMSYTPLVEPLSLDEAYLDVTDFLGNASSATELARAIQVDIKKATDLTASAGVSYNKFLAKIASGYQKPQGLTVISPKNGAAFIAALEIEKFHGIGPATAQKMRGHGITNGETLRAQPVEFLQEKFGKAGPYYFNLARGIDHRAVQPNRIRKSAGAERTFSEDIDSYDEAVTRMAPIVEKVWEYCRREGRFGNTLTLKIKYADFTEESRARTVSEAFDDKVAIETAAHQMLRAYFPARKKVRLLGLKISSFADLKSDRQLRLL